MNYQDEINNLKSIVKTLIKEVRTLQNEIYKNYEVEEDNNG